MVKYESVEGSAADPGFREGGSPGGLGNVAVIEESPYILDQTGLRSFFEPVPVRARHF